MMYCPRCAGRVTVTTGVIVIAIRSTSVSFKYGRILYCGSCALVTEIDDAGWLTDLGAVNLAHLAVGSSSIVREGRGDS